MTVQSRLDNANVPFILTGVPFVRETETVAQDEARLVDMAKYTLMSYDPTNANWVPFTDETATDGTQFPRGILMATLSAAEIAAGDVVDVPILVGSSITVDGEQLVIENSKTLATIINVPANINVCVRDALVMTAAIYVESVEYPDGYENDED